MLLELYITSEFLGEIGLKYFGVKNLELHPIFQEHIPALLRKYQTPDKHCQHLALHPSQIQLSILTLAPSLIRKIHR